MGRMRVIEYIVVLTITLWGVGKIIILQQEQNRFALILLTMSQSIGSPADDVSLLKRLIHGVRVL